LPRGFNTPYVNTIPPEQQPPSPVTGNGAPDQELHPLERPNGDGGQGRTPHTNWRPRSPRTTAPSAARFTRLGSITFFARTEKFSGDMVYFQGHAAPGILWRVRFSKGTLDEKHLQNFRAANSPTAAGCRRNPHPYLMPSSAVPDRSPMGLRPAFVHITKGAFNRYLQARGPVPNGRRNQGLVLWSVTGESDDGETLVRSRSRRARTSTTIVWVVELHLQRLDGPVRARQNHPGTPRLRYWAPLNVNQAHLGQ